MKKRTKNKSKLLILLLVTVCVALLVVVGLTATRKKTSAFADTATPYAITEQNGLGLGINVVKATQANEFNTSYSVLQLDKIPDMSAGKIALNKNESITHSTANIEDLILDFKLKFGLGGGLDTFLGSLKASLEAGMNINYKHYTYKYYNILEHKITRYNLYLNNYRDPKTYTDYFSQNFLNDLAALSTNKNYYAFFNKYGTHIIGSANYGGKLTATYAVMSNSVILNSDISLIMKEYMSFNKLPADMKANLSRELSAYFKANYSASDLETSFYVNALGGSAFASGTVEYFNDGYPVWAQSFNSDNNSILMDYTADGLVALWDILPAQYNSLSKEMKTAFSDYYNSFRDTVIDEFKSFNTVEFAGGTGSKTDPFLIENEKQFKNIEKVSMNANYKLISDVVLSKNEWVPLGGYYLTYKKDEQAAFNGSLDGNGKKISNLRRTADITEVSNRFYFGLFCYIGENGTVKNLTLDKVAIHMDGPEKNNSKTRVFVGALAGVVRGTVDNVVVKGECFYSVCTNGSVFFGGIAGSAYDAVIKNCKNESAVTSGRYTSAAGGIVGYSVGARIEKCSNSGAILSKCTAYGGYARAGGIVGLKYNGKDKVHITQIVSCTNSGTLDCTTYKNIKFNRSLYTDDMCATETENIYDKFE